MDKISIIIPVYNVEKYVEKCADSLFSQSYKNLELIFINDGSTDKSGELCHKIADTNPDEQIKIIVIDKENGGVSSARNCGLAIATGKYIMYVDPDDYCEPEYVEKLYRAIKDNECDMAECSYYIDYTPDNIKPFTLPFSEDVITDVYGALFYEKATGRMNKLPAYLWLGIFKADVIKENDIRFDESVKYGEDFLFFVEYSRFCHKIAVVNEPLYHSVHRDGSSASRLKFSIEHSMRTIYLTDEFARIMKNVAWGDKDYYIAKRYANFIPQASILLTRTKDVQKKRKVLKGLIAESKIMDRLGEYSCEGLSRIESLISKMVQHRRVAALVLYGRVYNALRNTKRKILKRNT